MGKVKVLVVDDSAFMRKIIKNLLEEDARIQVVATSKNGLECLQVLQNQEIDVITLDVEMPKMNGLDCLKEIMRIKPTPVIMLSSTTAEGTDNTISAMSLGAIDFLAKPSGQISLDLHKIQDVLISKVLIAKDVNINNFKKNSKEEKKLNDNRTQIINNITKQRCVIAIGTSTGGPRALQQVLTNLPKLDLPIFVVQHMPKGFTKSLADRLNTLCELYIKEAEPNEKVKNGTVYIAPGGFHMNIELVNNEMFIRLNTQDPRNGHRPSVDELFESISYLDGYYKIGVIMTGMGSDGTQGLKKMKLSKNCISIAESEETSIVFGMPKSAIQNDCVDEIVPLDDIAMTLLRILKV
ncbi:MAG: chemotaxis protein CheY [Bacillales bacterium]|jgi:two-component system chemotaxis response regulator CheB|nr:chemotaxis protein CheY [Bacillales bacterium]